MTGAAAGVPVTCCRACATALPPPVLSLGEQPLANALAADAGGAAAAVRHPLEVTVCPECTLAQLTVAVAPEDLFVDYAYHSSFSPAVTASARELVQRLVRERGLGPDDLALEVASNDGYLLQHHRAAGVRVLGVDPSRSAAAVAQERGVRTLCTFFTSELAAQLRADGVRAAVVHANNVLAHVPDPVALLAAIATVLREDGVAVVEVPWLRDLVAGGAFDTIYHEHLCYFSVTALRPLVRRAGLELVDVERIPLHGGSLRLSLAAPGTPAAPAVEAVLAEEALDGVATPAYLEGLQQRIDEVRAATLAAVEGAGGPVAGYGAAAKATVLTNAFGLDGNRIRACADHSPHKQGRWIPGSAIPVVAPQALYDDPPALVVVFAWTFADEVLAEHAELRRRGVRFLVPLPEPRLVEPEG